MCGIQKGLLFFILFTSNCLLLQLRTKYKTLKDNENELHQQLQEKLLQKDLYIEKLKQEVEQIKLNNHNISINGITYENSTKLSLLLNNINKDNNHSSLIDTVNVNEVAKKSIITQEVNNNLHQTTLPDASYAPIHITKHNSFPMVTNDNSTNSILSSPTDICHNIIVDTYNKLSSLNLLPSKSLLSSLSSKLPSSSSSPFLSEDTLMITNTTITIPATSTPNTATTTSTSTPSTTTSVSTPSTTTISSTTTTSTPSTTTTSASTPSTTTTSASTPSTTTIPSTTTSTPSTTSTSTPSTTTTSASTPSTTTSTPNTTTSTSATSTTTNTTTLNLPSSYDQDWTFIVNTEEKLIEQFVQLLNNWINSMKTNQNLSFINKEKLDHILMNRITQLESQLCEISLQYQLERKRRLKEQSVMILCVYCTYVQLLLLLLLLLLSKQSETKDDAKPIVHNSQVSDSNNPEQLSNSNNGKSDETSNPHKVIMKRLHKAIEESIYFASRANLLQDELESLIPWILQFLHLHQKQQYEIKTMKQYNEQLKQQLELIKINTIKQINEMAKHINNLTEELQTIRLNSFTNYHSHNSSNKEQQQQQSNCLSFHSNDNQVKKVSNNVITVVVIIVGLFI
ncbi:unnamed protein product [Schistosoma margrebowiei]|uniref:Uncharacterized protein n=1 Tax=Schistosoma margrebowiei TaxID=48269 RepID=A0A183MG53_9TREM|nr:unnamed protein product [Schistosoma margrebowiei]